MYFLLDWNVSKHYRRTGVQYKWLAAYLNNYKFNSPVIYALFSLVFLLSKNVSI